MKRAIPRKLLCWERTGSTDFDYVDLVFDSVDVLLSTRGAEIVERLDGGVERTNTDVQEDPGDLR